ncbi:MAG: tRNA (adenosine(37)-N6)-threonylcarbamoyltransferase complex dimerization subunit type 1 TsaB [Bacteroidota bacterium]
MPQILLIETSTDVCSVALAQAGRIAHTVFAPGFFTHGSQITLIIEQLLAESGSSLSALDAIAVGTGPGSYTALRVGLSAAKGLCFGLSRPLLAVPTLEAMASGMINATEGAFSRYAPMLDARRMEVYTALFTEDMQRIEADVALVVEDTLYAEHVQASSPICLGGPGAEKTKVILSAEKFSWTPLEMSASLLLEGAQKRFLAKDWADLAYLTPSYIKPPNITKSKKKWF